MLGNGDPIGIDLGSAADCGSTVGMSPDVSDRPPLGEPDGSSLGNDDPLGVELGSVEGCALTLGMSLGLPLGNEEPLGWDDPLGWKEGMAEGIPEGMPDG